MPDEPTQPRSVESHDPSLSPGTNRRLSAELQDVVGTETVEVRASRRDAAGDGHATHTAGVADLMSIRLGLVVTALVVLMTGGDAVLGRGGIAALVLLFVAVVAVVAVVVVVLLVARMTGEREHPSPELSADWGREASAIPTACSPTSRTSSAGRRLGIERHAFPQSVAPPARGFGWASQGQSRGHDRKTSRGRHVNYRCTKVVAVLTSLPG